jgi:F0F1-type ATP synthase assembly protein I
MNKESKRSLEDIKKDIQELKKKQNKTFIIHSKLPTSFKVCVEIFSGIITGLIVGGILDHIFNTNIVFTIISLILGCLASFMVLYRMMTK